MNNFHYDTLRSNAAFRGTVAPTRKGSKVQWFAHAQTTDVFIFPSVSYLSQKNRYKTDNSERLTVVRNVLKPTKYTDFNVFYRKREKNLTGSLIT